MVNSIFAYITYLKKKDKLCNFVKRGKNSFNSALKKGTWQLTFGIVTFLFRDSVLQGTEF